MIKAVIFDMDGVVVDTEQLNFVADSRVMKSVGIIFSEDDYVKYTGKPARQIYAEILGEKNTPANIEALLRLREDAIVKALRELGLQPNPGFSELCDKLKANGFVIALASSSSKGKVQSVLSAMKLDKLFSLVITGSDISRNKPDPQIYLETARRLGLRPEECVAIEDSITGIASAKGAGMKCIALITRHTKNQDISQADHAVESLADIDISHIQG